MENVLPLRRRSGSSGSESILFFLMCKADLYIQNMDIWCECSVKISWEDDYGEKYLGRLRGENSESCKRSQFSCLQLGSSTIKVIFLGGDPCYFKEMSFWAIYHIVHLYKTLDLFF